MPSLADPDDILSGNEKFLIYGAPKTGKTFLSLTAPEPIWFLGVGGKNELKTLYSRPFIEEHGRKEVHITAVSEDFDEQGQMSDNPNGFDRVCDAIDGFLEWNEGSGVGIKTIIVDNATVLEYYMLNKAIAAEYVIGGKDVEKSVLKREREHGIRKPHDSTWGGAQSLMDRITRWLFELPFNVVLVAHEYPTYVQVKGTRDLKLQSIEPLFVGKQRTQIPNAFDNVWRMRTIGGGRSQQFECQTVGDEIVSAGTRVGGILEHTERNLNLTEVIEEFKQYPKSLSEE